MASAADETKRLLRIARRKSDDGRRQLMAVCGDLLSGNGTVLTSLEYAMMRDILGRLVEALAAPLRLALGERLPESGPGCVELAAKLADRTDLTAPLLLGEDGVELAEIVRGRALEHRLMLAMRRSQTDADDGQPRPGTDALDTLLRFPDPTIPDLAMTYLVDQSRRFDEFLEPLVRPEELSRGLRRKLTVWLLAGLRHHLQQRHAIDATCLDDAVEAVAAETALAKPPCSRDAAMVLASRLRELGAITPALMLQVLRQGEVALFAALLAETAGLRLDLVRRLLFEPGGDGLAMICRATDLGRPVLASIFLLTRRAHPSGRTAGPGELSHAVGLYDSIYPDAARAVLARWRRSREFQTALRFIEEASGEAIVDSIPPSAMVDSGRAADADLASNGRTR